VGGVVNHQIGDDMLRICGVFMQLRGIRHVARLRSAELPFTNWAGFAESYHPAPHYQRLIRIAVQYNLRVHALWAAVARRERRSGTVIGPEQYLSRAQALHAFTMGGAVFCGVEAQRGSLEARKLADLVVLSDDPMQVPEAGLPDLYAHLAFVGGHVVYDSGVVR
jgi:hypothetical protein